jgi:ribose transport system substrate-binding protein
MHEKSSFNRREFLRLAGAVAGGAAATVILPGCVAPPPAGTAPAAATGAPAAGAAPDAGASPGMVDTSAYKKDGPWTVARAGSGDVNAWMVSFSAHLEYAIKEKNKDLFQDYFVTAANFDATKQISDVEDLLARQPDLLFVDPISEAALVGSVEKAMDAGIPVILVSTRVQSDKYVSWISTNNVRAGFTGADWLAKQLNGTGNIVMTMGAPGTSYSADWLQGARQAFAAYPDIKEVGVAYASWSPVEAKRAIEAFLQQEPNIHGVVPGGGLMAIGAVQAFKDAGKPIPPIGGADDGNGWLRVAKENNVKFIGVAGGANMGAPAVDLAIKTLRGEPIPKYVEFPAETITDADVDRLFKPELNDNYWGIHDLPEEWITRLYATS